MGQVSETEAGVLWKGDATRDARMPQLPSFDDMVSIAMVFALLSVGFWMYFPFVLFALLLMGAAVAWISNPRPVQLLATVHGLEVQSRSPIRHGVPRGRSFVPWEDLKTFELQDLGRKHRLALEGPGMTVALRVASKESSALLEWARRARRLRRDAREGVVDEQGLRAVRELADQ